MNMVLRMADSLFGVVDLVFRMVTLVFGMVILIFGMVNLVFWMAHHCLAICIANTGISLTDTPKQISIINTPL